MAEFDLVFEGGGAKGVAFAGALEVLEDAGHRAKRRIGTSAGAITAALNAAGYTARELLKVASERTPDGRPVFLTFLDPPERREISTELIEGSVTIELLRDVNVPLAPEWLERRFDRALLEGLLASRRYRQLFSLVERGGLFAGAAFLEWMQQRLARKGLSRNVTLSELADATGSDLSVTASDTSDGELLVLNRRTTPDLPVAWAVRMSMSIPFVWQEVLWRGEWGLYRGRDKTGNAVVDGGALSNFPLRLIAEPDSDDREIMGEPETNRCDNLGLLIDDQRPVPGQPVPEKPDSWASDLRTVERISRLISAMMKAADREVIARWEQHVCRIPAKGYGTLEFDLSGSRLSDFVEGGRRAMREHLASRSLC